MSIDVPCRLPSISFSFLLDTEGKRAERGRSEERRRKEQWLKTEWVVLPSRAAQNGDTSVAAGSFRSLLALPWRQEEMGSGTGAGGFTIKLT